MNLDRELVMAVLSFWCSATNTMVLPLGPIGVTVLDITGVLGTSLFGLLIDIALSGSKFDVDLKTTFEERVVEALTKEDQRPSKEDQRSSKEEVQKLHKNFFQLQHLDYPLRWFRK